MKHVQLGRSGLRVSEICLGAMIFGDPRSVGATVEDSRAIFDAFAEAGGSFIDTADLYGEGASERLVGEFVHNDRDRFVLSTKYSASRNGGILESGNSRRTMMRAVEKSLERLRTDRIDVYWLHAWDFSTPWQEILRGLDDLIRSGKVLYVGVSDCPAWEISRANMLAELSGWTSFAALQVEYSLLERTVERDLIPMARELSLGVTAWSPLAGGKLTGKYGRAGQLAGGRLGGSGVPEDQQTIVDTVSEIATELGALPSQVALAWLLARKQPRPIPILGARTKAQFEDNLKCLTVKLDSALIGKLDAVSAIKMGFPHDFLASNPVRSLMTGGQPERLM